MFFLRKGFVAFRLQEVLGCGWFLEKVYSKAAVAFGAFLWKSRKGKLLGKSLRRAGIFDCVEGYIENNLCVAGGLRGGVLRGQNPRTEAQDLPAGGIPSSL